MIVMPSAVKCVGGVSGTRMGDLLGSPHVALLSFFLSFFLHSAAKGKIFTLDNLKRRNICVVRNL